MLRILLFLAYLLPVIAVAQTPGATPSVQAPAGADGWRVVSGPAGTLILGVNAGLGLVGGPSPTGPTCFGSGSCGSGGAPDGMGGGTGMSGSENTAVGAAGLADCTACAWITVTGQSAGSHEVDGYRDNYYGTDSGKYALHNSDVAGYGSNTFKFVWNAAQDVATGDLAFSGNGFEPKVTAITGNGAGEIRLSVTSTNGMATGDALFVAQVGGTVEANTRGTPWFINVVDETHIDLQGSRFSNAYTSGGFVLDMPGGFTNQAIGGAASNGSKNLIRLSVPNTTNLNTGDRVHIGNVTGTTEANGLWVITVIDPWCISPGAQATCRVDLDGSAFVHAYAGGGQITDLNGPRSSIAGGFQALGSPHLTGAINNVAAYGPRTCANCASLTNALILGPGVGHATLGTTGHNQDIILLGANATTDVANADVQHAVGIGTDINVGDRCTQIGDQAGFHDNLSGGEGCTLVGFRNGFAMVNPVHVSSFGEQVGETVCASPTNVLLLGTDQNTDCKSGAESNAIHIGAGGGDIIYVTGTGTPGTSVTAIGGGVTAAHLATTGTIGGAVCATATGIILYERGASDCTISLEELKRDITAIPDAVADLMALKPIAFEFNDPATAQRRYGFGARQVNAVDPRLSSYDGKGTLQAYDPNGILAVAVATVQRQQSEIVWLRWAAGILLVWLLALTAYVVPRSARGTAARATDKLAGS